jgi:hypothetical protein
LQTVENYRSILEMTVIKEKVMKIALNIYTVIILNIYFTQGFASDTSSEATKRFEEGKSYFKQGKYRDASASFRAAYELKPSWKLFYNIAQSDAAARNYGCALEAFERYLSEGGDEIPVDRENAVIREISTLKNKVGSVQLSAPSGASVWVNDIHRGVAPLPGTLRIAAGREQRLLVKQGDDVLLDRVIRVGVGENLKMTAEAKGDSTPVGVSEQTTEAAAPAEIPDAAQWPLGIIGWSLVGTGGAMLLGSAITGCLDKVCTDPGARDRHDRARTLGVVTNVLLSGGAVVAAAGLSFLIVDYKKQKAEKPALSVIPAAEPGMTGLILKGRF